MCMPLADSRDVWQKPVQHCKAIIFQLKISLKRVMNVDFLSPGIKTPCFHCRASDLIPGAGTKDPQEAQC